MSFLVTGILVFGCSSNGSDGGTSAGGSHAGNQAGAAGAASPGGSPAGGAAGTAGFAGSGSGASGTGGTGASGTGTGGAGTGGSGTGGSGTGGSGTGGSGTSGTGAGGTSTSGGAGGTLGGAGTLSGGGAGGAAGGSGKFVGNITTGGQVRSDFATYWNQISPENEGKWGTVEVTQDQMNWSGLDAIYAYTKAHGTIFKQHNFVWGQQQPTWIGALSAADQKAQVEQWISLFCARYPDVAIIDVVNEPTHNQPVYMNAIGGAGVSGYDWVVQALNWAHQYCPNAILLVNDYNTIEYGADRDAFITLAKAVKAAGAPINGIGAQAHDAYKLSASTVQTNLDMLASQTGLPVYITEFDINEPDDAMQKADMQNLMTLFETDANVTGITLWGYIEGQTWETNTGLMTASGTLRPAMQWLVSSGYLLK
jgi:endo-1,4-beta-xylanase